MSKKTRIAPVFAASALLALALTGCTTGNTDYQGDDFPTNATTTVPSSSASAEEEEADTEANSKIEAWAQETLEQDGSSTPLLAGQGHLNATESHEEAQTTQAAGDYALFAVCRDGGPVTFTVESGGEDVASQEITCDNTVTRIAVSAPEEGVRVTLESGESGADWAYALRDSSAT